MAMPKKGRRRVHVAGRVYNYKVKAGTSKGQSVAVIELPNGNYLSMDFGVPCRPSDVKAYLERVIPDEWRIK